MIARHSPTGKLIRGHVLDVSRGPLEAALRSYDPLLYIKWEPKKLRGWGCWSIWRRPEEKSIKDMFEFEGMNIAVLEYKEIPIVNHVLDVPFLNYDVVNKIKKMDTWQQSYKGKDFTNYMDYAEAKFDEKVDEKAAKDLDYNLKQMKREVRYFRDYVLSGQNPADLARYWNNS